MTAVADRVPPLQQDAVAQAVTAWLASVAATVQVAIYGCTCPQGSNFRSHIYLNL